MAARSRSSTSSAAFDRGGASGRLAERSSSRAGAGGDAGALGGGKSSFNEKAGSGFCAAAPPQAWTGGGATALGGGAATFSAWARARP